MYFCQLEEPKATSTRWSLVHKERGTVKKSTEAKDKRCGGHRRMSTRERERLRGQDGHYPECCEAAECVISLGQLKIKARGQNLTCERMHGTSTHNQCHRQMEQNKTASFTGSRRNHRSTEKPLHCAIPHYHAIIQSKILQTPF